MVEYLEQAGFHAVVVAAIVEALRSKISWIDGWRVVVAAFVIAMLVCGLSIQQPSFEAVVGCVRMGLLTGFLAVGGNAWVAKIAAKVGGVT